MVLTHVKALLFDVFGTVVDWRTGVAREVAGFFDRHAAEGVDPLAFADAWRTRYQPAMEEIRSGSRGFTRLDTLHRENLGQVISYLDIAPEGFDDSDLDDLTRAWHRLDPWPDALAGLSRLKTRFIVAPLSNGNVALLLNMAKRAGLPWDAILGAELVQAYKPAQEAYLRTADMLGLAPHQICLVAAHNDDLAAARDCGWRTAFVPRPAEHGEGQTIDLAPEQDWDVIASDFLDLADRLGVPTP